MPQQISQRPIITTTTLLDLNRDK
ncbi:TPA: hypothetical protein ANIA_11592 [Aspergillus nidulans FGSC A4]|uniref:Uncharacterized protein n=1 Tax=Emericella nidulans (strain FGSC A4 / ATCC 38163 / CBS 112.46 / NRRL 194 / M139) TaxID=227321 RepID=C8V6X2_EMENI|nr:TPA: hypothetical protein ANIA_11592 [Aspergillus nidulans FGSC A4]